MNMFVETFPVCSMIQMVFFVWILLVRNGPLRQRQPAHSPSKMNSDNLIQLDLRSPNPHAPSAALEVSVFAASSNPGFCAPAVSLLVDAAVRMLLNVFRSLYSAL